MRNYGKAMEIARAVAATQPFEDAVVSTLGCTFKVLYTEFQTVSWPYMLITLILLQYKQILKAETDFAELYENALKKKNLDATYVIELFSCYCRLNDPKKMQFIAQKLHKATPDRVCYLYWSIACMMLQDLPPTMMVLAEKMAFKVLYDLNALTQPSADEMGLYSFILVRQGVFCVFYFDCLFCFIFVSLTSMLHDLTSYSTHRQVLSGSGVSRATACSPFQHAPH